MSAKLTPKQEAFCVAYIKTGNASEAYRSAYNTKGDTATVNRSAKALLDNPKIAPRLNQLQAPAAKRAQITLEQHLRSLERLRDDAHDAAAYGPAITAEMARGKASGLYIEKVELSGHLTLEQMVTASLVRGE